MPIRDLARLVLLAGSIAACAQPAPSGENAIVSGWSLGPEVDCASNSSTCDAMLPVGRRGLDAYQPGHAAITQERVYSEGLYRDDQGSYEPRMGSGVGGCCYIVLFGLADGSWRAIGISSPLVGGPADLLQPIDHPPGP